MANEICPEGGYLPRQRRLHGIIAGPVVLQLLLGAIVGTTQLADHRRLPCVHAAAEKP
jgi:hypothetical protein